MIFGHSPLDFVQNCSLNVDIGALRSRNLRGLMEGLMEGLRLGLLEGLMEGLLEGLGGMTIGAGIAGLFLSLRVLSRFPWKWPPLANRHC